MKVQIFPRLKSVDDYTDEQFGKRLGELTDEQLEQTQDHFHDHPAVVKWIDALLED